MAASLDDLSQALANADAAGDKEGASMLAAEIRRMQSDVQKPALEAEKTPMDKFNSAAKMLMMGQPAYWAGKGMEKIGEQVSHAAYDAGGKVTDLTGSPEAGWAANVAVEAVPALLGGEMAKLGSPAVVEKARRIMQSALKPTAEQLRTGKAAQAIDTMLDTGTNVTPGGVLKMKHQISKLNDQIDSAIANSTATVDKGKAASTLHDLLAKVEKQATPGADMKLVQEAWNEFLAHPLLAGSNDIPVSLAQQIKRGTYQSLGGKAYGEVKGASEEAQKSIARGLKEGVAAAVPEVGPLNAKESKLLNALEIAERRVNVANNRDIAGISMLAHNPAAFVASMADRSELVKSLLARLLYANQRTLPQAAGNAAGGVLGGIAAQPGQQGILAP